MSSEALERTKYNKMRPKPVKFKHRLQGHPAIIKLYLFFQKFVSGKVVISKVVLEREEMFRLEITIKGVGEEQNYLNLPDNFHFSWRHIFLIFCHDSSAKESY